MFASAVRFACVHDDDTTFHNTVSVNVQLNVKLKITNLFVLNGKFLSILQNHKYILLPL